MGKVIGAASDFYRLRVSRIDASDEPELDWRDDILYRDPPSEALDEEEDWRVEAVLLGEDAAIEIARFTEEDQAHSLMSAVQEDLESVTKSAFEERYLSAPEPASQADQVESTDETAEEPSGSDDSGDA